MGKFFKIAALVAVLIFISACGGGGSTTTSTATPTPTTLFSQTYTASATAGELMTYSIDTSALTYSYTITKSSYGCEVVTAACHTGSGTLIKNTDGTYSPTTSPTAKIYALKNGLLVGSVKLALNGIVQNVPILGVANPATAVGDLAGTFNYMSLQCTSKSYGVYTGCATFHGTVTVASNGSFTSCTNGNIAAATPACQYQTSGVLTSLGDGIFKLQATAPAVGSQTNYMVAFTAPNGQKVGFIDFNDSVVYGYGQTIVSSSVDSVTADIIGDYAYSNDYGGAGKVTINPNSTTSTGLAITQNTPWKGIATVTGGSAGAGYGILAGNGVYVYRNPTIPSQSAYFEIGLKIN